ncbi:hypothetical protein WICPIJ_007861 [Wickerhamomyces pijperi]|uniref:Uncharacterized protein n=1 Tax=Wickerhamomyces pijperi TaxID=599730 RepID=A0A9P8TJI7_WICPI|nr:hypothetical protein WICPIJ_007861 [Wickerhamomyces pijperi]
MSGWMDSKTMSILSSLAAVLLDLLDLDEKLMYLKPWKVRYLASSVLPDPREPDIPISIVETVWYWEKTKS